MSIDINHIEHIKTLFDKITWYQEQLDHIQSARNFHIELYEQNGSHTMKRSINFSENNPTRDLFIADIRRPLIAIFETKIAETITELKLYNVEISQ